MAIFLKVLVIFILIYIGFRMITKPFRDYIRAIKKQTEIRKDQRASTETNDTKTKDLGEYIDYEEVE